MQNVKRIFPRRIIFKIRSFVRFSVRIRCFRYRFFFLCVCFYERTFTNRSLFPFLKQKENFRWSNMTVKKGCRRISFVPLKASLLGSLSQPRTADLRVFMFADYIIALLTFLDTQPGKNYLPEAIPSITCTRCPVRNVFHVSLTP